MAYTRRKTHEITVGSIRLGGDNPIRVQSMTNTDTMDTEASVAQILRIAGAGGDIVRLTTQGTREAENMAAISRAVRLAGCDVPLVADVHFNPNVADVAALYCEKVRINPGNYVDTARKFKQLEYTDEEYARELQKIEDRLVPFLDICRLHGTAVRIGVNHGSLSDRIMSRYGDTPEGIVESCMEFLRICMRHDFSDVVISIKASNTVVMVQSVRLLVQAMDREGMTLPPAPGRHRGRRGRGRTHKECRGHRRTADRGPGRHHPREPVRGAGEGDTRGNEAGKPHPRV